MLDNINSIYIYLLPFSFIDEKMKLEIIKYNKALQKKLNINLINYKFFSGKYIIYTEKNTAKEYNIFNNRLIFEGEYSNKKRNGKGKEYFDGILTFDGEYLNGKRSGKGIEYSFGNIIFKGEYLNGKRWNGFLFSQKDDIIYIFEDACGCCSEYYNDDKIKIEGKTLTLIRKGEGMRYYTSNDKYEIKNGKGYLKEENLDLEYVTLKFEGEYLNGDKNGKGKEYNDSGRLTFEGEYLNGKKWNGKIYEYEYDFGTLIGEFKLENGKGSIKHYYSDGKLKLKYEYINGEKNGLSQKYYKNGQLENEIPYLNGKISGKKKRYDEEGKLRYEIDYLYGHEMKGVKLNGNIDKNNCFDNKLHFYGTFVDNSIWNANVKVYRSHHNSTELVFEGEYLDGERWDGEGKGYYCGHLAFEGYYLKGKKSGKVYEHYGKNPLNFKYIGRISGGLRDGFGKEYDENNRLIFEGIYDHGERMRGKEYDCKGNLIYEGYYQNGERKSNYH